jgi:hypothetical protein
MDLVNELGVVLANKLEAVSEDVRNTVELCPEFNSAHANTGICLLRNCAFRLDSNFGVVTKWLRLPVGLIAIAQWYDQIEYSTLPTAATFAPLLANVAERAKLLMLIWQRARATNCSMVCNLPAEMCAEIHRMVNRLSSTL